MPSRGWIEKDGHRNITGSRRHVHKHKVYAAPDRIGPELFYRIGDNGTPPTTGSVS